jgi:Ca2+-binding RTX toxin-like protein
VLTLNAAAGELTAADQLFGGTTANDVLNITSTGDVTSNVTGVTRVETINFAMNGNGLNQTLVLDTLAGEVSGGNQVINVTGGNAARNFNLHAGTATANLTVNAGGDFDDIQTGSGADRVTVSGGGNRVNTGAGGDTITVAAGGPNLATSNSLYGGLGGDTITGGEGVDFITGDDGASGAGGGGNDTLNGGGGADRIRGESGNDTIHGDGGNDTIYGGLGADVLWGDAGTDTYLYAGLADSPFNARDIVHMDSADLFDFRDLAATGTSVAFKGSYATFEDAQSAVVAGDGVIDVVYNQASNRLWVDLNDDGTLDGNDLQITIVFEDGATDVTAANIIQGDVVAPTPLADFNGAFTAPFAP